MSAYCQILYHLVFRTGSRIDIFLPPFGVVSFVTPSVGDISCTNTKLQNIKKMMKKKFIILLLSIPFLLGCAHKISLKEKFSALKSINYSEFSDMSIINRKGVYFVSYHGATYEIKRSFFTKKISSVEMAFSKDTNVLLTKKDTDYIELALKSFDKIKILSLSIDENGNVFLSLPWHDRCTYHFLKLSSSNTLEDIKKQHYQNYEDNWYMDKECSERRYAEREVVINQVK